MWPFNKKVTTSRINASSITVVDGVTEIDVRGQTCPGYLLAINKAVETLEKGAEAKLLITYPPCGDDVKAWCNEREIEYQGISEGDGMWVIKIKK